MDKKILLTLLLSLSEFCLLAQDRAVTGTVTSKEDKQPIPGVNVFVPGTTRGTTTDVNGAYKLNLEPMDSTLSFSFVGYKSEVIAIGSQAIIDVVLEVEISNLQEVVVVGYGSQKKSDITGATASIKGEELFKQPVVTATQALQGKMAGVQIISSGQPGVSPQIRIRGISTALAKTTTLYVVDGVLTDDITNINTADIVDISVLKDASAAAIYGSRGANGVVIITTRSGVKGNIKVTYNGTVGMRQAANLVPMANAAEYANYVQAASGQPTPAPLYNANTDWYNTILKTAWEQTHNVSVSGATDKSNFLFNVGYLNTQGIVVGNTFKRLTLRLNSDYTLMKNLTLGVQSSYTNSINQNGFNAVDINENGYVGSAFTDAYRAAPIIPGKVNGLYGNTSAYQNVGNPLLDLTDNSVKVAINRLQGSTHLEYKPLTWLTLKSQFGADWQNSLNRIYNYPFSASDGKTFLTPNGNQFNLLSDLLIKEYSTFRRVFNNYATLTKTFGKHDFTLLLGTTAEKYTQQWILASRNSVPADPNLWYIGVGNANSSQNDGGGDAWTRSSYLSRLNYAYDGKYLITATLRRDGSSRLNPKNRWQNYPSVGVAWILTKEQFFQNQKVFDFLKIRGSYGKVGNDQIPTNAFNLAVAQNNAYPFSSSTSAAENGTQINQIIDPNITWEITQEYDVAVEFGIIRSKLTGEVNYYNKTVDNALINVPIPSTAGNTIGNSVPGTVLTNAASIQNTGVEVLLNWKDDINKNWSYAISGNVTFNKNNVVKLNGGQNIFDGSVGNQSYVTNTDVGHPVGSFYVLKTKGVFNSDADVAADPTGYTSGLLKQTGYFNYQDTNADGRIDANDRVFVGSYQPIAYYGMNLELKYKHFDFSVGIFGNAGNKVYNGKRASRTNPLDNIEQALVYNRWTPQNLTQSQPIANGGNLPASDYFVESGSFVRINNLTLGYTLPAEVLSRLKITGFRVYATSQNLYTYKKYSGFSAELPGGPTDAGIETSTYPTTRTVALGVNIGF